MSIDTLIFDWDGTLADSIGHIVSTMQSAAVAVGLPVPSDEAVKGIIGLGLPEAAAVLFPQRPDLAVPVVDAYRDIYLSDDQQAVPLFAGVRQALDDWREEGYLLAVATGKGRRGLNRVLGQHDLLDYFDATRCADETVSKPDPAMLHQILRELGRGSGAAVMVGDSSFDIQMAHNAGMRAVAVSYGAQSRDQLEKLTPVACMDRFVELAPWLSGQRADSRGIGLERV